MPIYSQNLGELGGGGPSPVEVGPMRDQVLKLRSAEERGLNIPAV